MCTTNGYKLLPPHQAVLVTLSRTVTQIPSLPMARWIGAVFNKRDVLRVKSVCGAASNFQHVRMCMAFLGVVRW